MAKKNKVSVEPTTEPVEFEQTEPTTPADAVAPATEPTQEEAPAAEQAPESVEQTEQPTPDEPLQLSAPEPEVKKDEDDNEPVRHYQKQAVLVFTPTGHDIITINQDTTQEERAAIIGAEHLNYYEAALLTRVDGEVQNDSIKPIPAGQRNSAGADPLPVKVLRHVPDWAKTTTEDEAELEAFRQEAADFLAEKSVIEE